MFNRKYFSQESLNVQFKKFAVEQYQKYFPKTNGLRISIFFKNTEYSQNQKEFTIKIRDSIAL